MVQAVEHLTHKHEALSSNSSLKFAMSLTRSLPVSSHFESELSHMLTQLANEISNPKACKWWYTEIFFCALLGTITR
jgi:hypothetical protein